MDDLELRFCLYICLLPLEIFFPRSLQVFSRLLAHQLVYFSLYSLFVFINFLLLVFEFLELLPDVVVHWLIYVIVRRLFILVRLHLHFRCFHFWRFHLTALTFLRWLLFDCCMEPLDWRLLHPFSGLSSFKFVRFYSSFIHLLPEVLQRVSLKILTLHDSSTSEEVSSQAVAWTKNLLSSILLDYSLEMNCFTEVFIRVISMTTV